jgi:hypothetical protein
MTNYTKTTDFAAKDALPSGNSAKIVKGSEIDTEFNNIATASATKANANSAALTGTTTFETISDGTIAITAFVDEDNMASDSATLLPTQQSVKAYVDSQVTAQDLDVTDGSTSIDIDLDSESLGILGGTGIDSTASGTGVTLAIDSTVATLTGSQTLSNKTLSTPVVSGNLTTDGLLDGRDVAADGTKLDGIESGATADQTAAEIKTAYESNADTNAFTDADESKLDGIEASADVTDTANVTAAGALMDSELTSEASVKALNQGVATTDSPTFAGLTTTADVSFGDNDKAIFGAGSDLQIYHDGSNSHITEGGTGDLIIRGANIEIQTGGGNKYFQGASNAARLYHTNNEKLTTTAAGISVTGTATMDGLTVDGIASVSATNPKIQLFETDTTDLNTQIQNQAGDFIVSRLDDDAGSLTVHFSIDHSTGNVSIPSGDLDVTGTVTADGLTVDGGNTIRLNASSTNDFLTLTQNGTQAVITADSDATGSLVFQTTSAGSSADRLEIAAGGDISFYEDTGTTPKLFWDSSAESLGIGTTSPDDDLHIANNTQAGPALRLENQSVSTDSNTIYASINFEGNDNSAGANGIRGSIVGKSLSTNGAMGLLFSTASAGGSNTERMRIDASGNLLVGKTALNTNTTGLQLESDGYLSACRSGGNVFLVNRKSSDGAIITLQKDGTSVGSIGSYSGVVSYLVLDPRANGAGLMGLSNEIAPANESGNPSDAAKNLGSSSRRFKDLYLSANCRSTSFVGIGDNDTLIRMGGSDVMQFFTANSERARLDASGNLLVGGTTLGQDDSLGVAQNGKLTIAKASSSSAVMASFKNGGTSVGTIVTSTTATAYNTSSDQRLKENIADADDAGSKVDAIQVRKFDWIADGSHQDYGMIAQELQSVAPEAVSGDADSDDMMGVDYSKLVPMLVKEIQSLRARVAQLEN